MFRHYIFITWATPFICGLILTYSIAEHAVVSTLINHLTEAQGESVAMSAIMVNMFEGFTAVLLVPAATLFDCTLGYFLGVLCFYTIYIYGLILTRFLDSERESVSQMVFGLALMSTGKAAETPLRALMEYQIREREKITSQVTDDTTQLLALEEGRSRQQEETDAQEQRIQARNEIWWYCPWTIGAVGVFFWDINGIQYDLLSTVMAVGLLCFWSGETFRFYAHHPVSNPLFKVYNVIKAAIMKRHYQYPEVEDQFLNNENQHIPLSPDRPFLRWLDKSAINNVRHEEETIQIDVADVEEVKFFLMMAPMLSLMLIYSVIEGLVNTFFLEEATSMNRDFDVTYFVIIKSITGIVARLLFPDRLFTNRRTAILLKIGIGMMCSPLCCLTAYVVHNMHLECSLDVFWLTQFMFLGLMKGLAKGGIDDLITDQVSVSLRIYGKASVKVVEGLAKFLCVLLIHSFRSWFSDDLRQLDKYYILLGICGAGNVLLYWFVMQVYVEQQPQTEENISGNHPTGQAQLNDINEGSSNASPIHEEQSNDENISWNHLTGQAQLNDINEGSSNASPIHEDQSNDVPDDRNASLQRLSSEKNAREENKNKSLKRSLTA